MKSHTIAVFFLLIFSLTHVFSCKSDKSPSQINQNRIAIGIAADLDYLNPLLIQLSLSREICNLIFPTLVKPYFDEESGELKYNPSLAKSWEFSEKGDQVTFNLRSDALWQDGKSITSSDLKFSYTLYANPKVASTRQHYVNDLLQNGIGEIDFERAVQTPNDSTLILTFQNPMAENIVLDHFYDLMPVAKHIFESYSPEEIRQKSSEIPIVGGGPYKVVRWKRQQELVLESNKTSTLPYGGKINRLSFLVIPEYTTRLTLFKTGKIDVLMSAGGINPKDVDQLLTQNPNLSIKSVQNRNFDSIVWLMIDGDAFRTTGKIQPNALFGDKRVRQAMTYAINRSAIVDGFMGTAHATIVNTSLSPAYTRIMDTSLHNYDYNPQKASQLLKEAGWEIGSDGVLQNNGRRFEFDLVAPTGNARRNYAATIVQENLKDLGIVCNIQFAETVVFVKNQNNYNYDAAMSGLSAETLPFQLIIWGSDFVRSPFNSSAFQHKQLDDVIAKLNKPLPDEESIKLWHQYQQIIHEWQPRTFLYYFDELEGFNKRIKNVDVNMLAVLYNAYDWELN